MPVIEYNPSGLRNKGLAQANPLNHRHGESSYLWFFGSAQRVWVIGTGLEVEVVPDDF